LLQAYVKALGIEKYVVMLKLMVEELDNIYFL